MRIMSTPRNVEVEVTSRCNLRCKYCSHFSSEGDVAAELTTGEWLRFFTECSRLGVMNILFTGGEPFLRADFPELAAAVSAGRMRFSVNSNGTLISAELAGFIADTRRCDSIQISIDGHCAAVHDSLRGEGTFEKALAGLENLRSHGLPVAVRLTIHRQNIDHLEQIAAFLLEELKLPGFSTNAAMHVGLMRQHRDLVQLDAEHYSRAMQQLLDLNRRYKNRIDATAGPLADAHYWPMMHRACQERREGFDGCGVLSSCGCAFNTIAARADGVIVPCNQINGYELGRVGRDSLRDIWRSSGKLQRYRQRSMLQLETFAVCGDCEYRPYCRGGCPASIYAREKNAFIPSHIDCLKTFLARGGRLPEAEVSHYDR